MGRLRTPGMLEHNFHGWKGKSDVVVVSMHGARDEACRLGRGEAFFHLVTMAMASSFFSLAVVYERTALTPDFWELYKFALGRFAQGMRYIVVLTTQNCEIGNFQRQEVSYVDHCDGAIGDGFRRPKLMGDGVHFLAMRFKEFQCWERCFECRPDCLGCVVPDTAQNHFVQNIPALDTCEANFLR